MGSFPRLSEVSHKSFYNMKKLLFILVATCQSFVMFSQYHGVEVPKIDKVNTFNFLERIIPVFYKIDSIGSKSLYVGEERIGGIEQLESALLQHYIAIGQKNEIWMITALPELVVDNAMSMKDFEQLKTELQRLELNEVILSAKTDVFTRLEQVWTTGIYHKINPLNLELLNKSPNRMRKEPISKNPLRTAALEKINLSKPKPTSNPPAIPPPPPPPPPMEDESINPKIPKYYTENFLQSNPNITKHHILLVSGGGFQYNQQSGLNISALTKLVTATPIDPKSCFVLEYDATSTYQQYVEAINLVSSTVIKQRMAYCSENLLGDYFKLGRKETIAVDAKIPFNLIEKPLYAK